MHLSSILDSSEKYSLKKQVKLAGLLKKIQNRLRFNKEFKAFKALAKNHTQRFDLNGDDVFRCMNDNTSNTGFDRHYVYHTSWAARYLQQSKVKEHTDISSTLFFCGVVSAFLKVNFFDYRPANLVLSDLSSQKADLTNLEWKD